jgi:succinate-semialdehyde dehydrogenase / glutarate-semialdehyde dehydrogenase
MAATADETRVVDAVPHKLYIGGEWRDAGGGGTLPVEDPATGEVLAEVADATHEDADAALQAATDAFATWRNVPPRERGDILRRAYDLMMGRADELATLMTLEMGKPVAESKAEIAYAAAFFRWYAEEAVRINGRFTVNENGKGRVLTMRQPVGPCLFITPWNFPMAMGTRKVGPALAAGCTCVVKPAKQTPLSMLAMAQILEEAGLPGGVVNVITASKSGEIMEPLIKDPRTRKLSFTGSTEVGKALIRQGADQVLRMSMELGGNAPFLVFEDADLDLAVEGAMLAKMRNTGEACTSANRFHVADAVAEEFADKLARRMGELKVGRGTEDGVQVGPLIDDAQRSKVEELVNDAVSKGATVAVGGQRVDGAGYFFEPTVLTDVPENAELLREEIFGPVAPI